MKGGEIWNLLFGLWGILYVYGAVLVDDFV